MQATCLPSKPEETWRINSPAESCPQQWQKLVYKSSSSLIWWVGQLGVMCVAQFLSLFVWVWQAACCFRWFNAHTLLAAFSVSFPYFSVIAACDFHIKDFCSNPVAGSVSGRIQAKMASFTVPTFILLSHGSLKWEIHFSSGPLCPHLDYVSRGSTSAVPSSLKAVQSVFPLGSRASGQTSSGDM